MDNIIANICLFKDKLNSYKVYNPYLDKVKTTTLSINNYQNPFADLTKIESENYAKNNGTIFIYRDDEYSKKL